MLHLGYVLQFVIDGLNNGSLSCQHPVRDSHDGTLHVALQFRYQLYAVNKQPLEESFADISLVPDELAIEELHERLVLKGLAVIDITWGNHEVKQSPLFVANQMQLEPKEPPHGAFASLSDALECLVDMNALVPANSQRGAVNEADSCALAQQDLLDEKRQRDSDFLFQLNEAVVGHKMREQVAEMTRHMLQIEVL